MLTSRQLGRLLASILTVLTSTHVCASSGASEQPKSISSSVLERHERLQRLQPLYKAHRNHRLSASLDRFVQAAEAGGDLTDLLVSEEGLTTDNSKVLVTVELRSPAKASNPGQDDAAEAIRQIGERITAYGDVVRGSYGHLLSAFLSPSLLKTLSADELVERIYESIPSLRTGDSTTLQVTNAASWQKAGYTGASVKVGVLDVGFSGYQGQEGTSLPSRVDISCGIGTSTASHGERVAEVVHNMAPGADLYLANAGATMDDFCNAIRCLLGKGVQVINFSRMWALDQGPLDGATKTVQGVERNANKCPDDAVRQGIVWTNSAGNSAQGNWRGFFVDADGDGRVDFSYDGNANAVNENQITNVNPGTTFYAQLLWDDPWGGPVSASYEVCGTQRTKFAGLQVPFTGSVTTCSGPDFPNYPFAVFKFTPGNFDDYTISVKNVAGPAKLLHLLVFASELTPQLAYSTAATSLGHPADVSSVIAVGASSEGSWGTIEPYSSQGPTDDGRIKPDLTGPTDVAVSYQQPTDLFGFGGTSAAAPNVAGAAALAIGAGVGTTPGAISSFLRSRATSAGADGPDDVFGFGLLNLGDPSYVGTLDQGYDPAGEENAAVAVGDRTGQTFTAGLAAMPVT